MQPILSLVLDRQALRRPLLSVIEAAVRGGVDWVQIRDRALDTRALLSLSLQVSQCAHHAARSTGRRVEVLVNRRVDVALALPADGVHLGGDALRGADARQLLGSKARIGMSTHAPDEARTCATQHCDYVHLAPIFAPLSKPAERPALGLSALAEACTHGIPVLAQGGIDADNCRDVLATGAAGVAVTGSISLAEDPASAAARLRSALDA